MSIITGYPEELLDAFMEMPLRESYVKLELLDWNENFIQEIQGIVTNGSISLDGKSSMRRTCNFTVIVPDGQDEYELSKIINLNKKFRLYIGYKNNLIDYQDYPEILWFKMGLYVFITANFNHSTSGTSISITARDKMCLLNGQVQGIIPESVILHDKETYVYDDPSLGYNGTLEVHPSIPIKTEVETIDGKEVEFKTALYKNANIRVSKKIIPIWVRTIIYELVSHYGRENKGKIYINDVPEYGRMLVKYIGTNPVYLTKNNGVYTDYNTTKPTEENFETKGPNDLVGYKITKFIFPGELIANVGDTVTTLLDKICTTFGNYEYFYDIDGNFIFQEKKNYLNNSFVPLTQNGAKDLLMANFNKSKCDYSFKDNKIVSVFTNNPKWENIKNDFVVWGKRTSPSGKEWPIHFHIAIDNLPIPTDEQEGLDYRQIILNNDRSVGESAASDYYTELDAFWGQNYDEESGMFKEVVDQDPTQLNYWLEIYPAQGRYAKYSVPAIGRRTYAINDDNATCIYPPQVPGLVFYENEDEFEQGQEYMLNLYFNGYKAIKITSEMASALAISEDRKSCYEVIREALYKHLSLQETITIQCLPVHWLEPGDLIEVKDNKSNIYGEYIITNMTIPLTHNGLMSITAMRADQRI